VEGVAGPESANNSATSGAFIPLLALGIPSGAVPAVMLAALMIHGVSPGPQLMQNRPDIFWGFIASMYVGNVVLLILNLPMVGLFVNLLRIPYAYLYPFILALCLLGVYAINQSTVDVWIAIGFGLLGYFLRKLEFDTAPLVLGVILAPMLELAIRQSLAMSGGDWTIFARRPIAGTMLVIAAILVVYNFASREWRTRVGLEAK
jgi:putative tricarboxylic transport membrane protein